MAVHRYAVSRAVFLRTGACTASRSSDSMGSVRGTDRACAAWMHGALQASFVNNFSFVRQNAAVSALSRR